MGERLSESINIGVADMTFLPEGEDIPIYLGLTKGGVTLKYEAEYHTLTSDQTGKTPLDDVGIGETVTVEFHLLDTSLEKMTSVMPTASPEKEGDHVKAVTFGRRPGLRLTHHSGKLVIHPISAGPGDLSKDVIIYRAGNKAGLELAYKLDDEWVIPCKYTGYYDDFRPEGDQLFRIGEDIQTVGEKRVVKFWITPSNPELQVSKTIDFKANAMFEDGTTQDVTKKCKWISADEEIATIRTSGDKAVASAIKSGTVVIRAEYVGYSNSTTLVVEN
ncbi:Ig-like domain-containing protein [Anaerophilus nitritogenes]|uniref:Ig-like domain-containing protein n=1 Tax=Anaerophilus nitritogenes TaxID=2498136 RepID=UPI00101D48A8|nr:Ig-like domain-containing protein [Anaerophilus nitritogenes]